MTTVLPNSCLCWLASSIKAPPQSSFKLHPWESYDGPSLAPSHGPPASPAHELHPRGSQILPFSLASRTWLSILLHESTKLSSGSVWSPSQASCVHMAIIFPLKIQTSSNHPPASNPHQLSLPTEQNRNSLVLHWKLFTDPPTHLSSLISFDVPPDKVWRVFHAVK